MKPSLAVDVSGKGDHYTNSGADGFFVFEQYAACSYVLNLV
ncbi:hypothetical protein EW026_g3636 [Hermanssonia centrifuga]|uniref:Uncharacterized protein n=1 Tax=Hermanssonia centrifuga TaxID=98765 RepID=A0A4S4KJH7_9APHY|nr:hypothetical protein EW026_g3636 [Hermanssonia centrifuga]